MAQLRGNEEEDVTQECRELLLSLPVERGWRTSHLYLFQNFWCQPKQIQAIVSCQRHHIAHDTDVVLATVPKSGTTWLKALAYAIVNRDKFAASSHPLLTSNPHDLVPFFEYNLYAENRVPDRSRLPHPGIFGTHVPYHALADSVKRSGCKIVYLCRNPFDTFVSAWLFILRLRPDGAGPFPMEEAFDMFCRGVIGYGPPWDHMLGYWKESKERPEKVLFLKYEDMMGDVGLSMRKLADFLGYPFSLEEEKKGAVEEISRLCSFDNMKELEVNKSGRAILNLENKNLFRKGEVGDFVNHLSPKMVERLRELIDEKLRGSGLSFDKN